MDEPGGTRKPADVTWPACGGYWVAREVPGGGDADDRFAQAVAVQLDGYAADRHDARRLVRRMLLRCGPRTGSRPPPRTGTSPGCGRHLADRGPRAGPAGHLRAVHGGLLAVVRPPRD